MIFIQIKEVWRRMRYIVLTLALALAAAFCWLVGGFEGYMWLWQVPVGFIVCLAVMAAALFLTLWISCLFVDTSKPQKKDSFYYRHLTYFTTDIVFWVLRVRLHTKGLEKTPKHGRFLLVCNHINDLDPVLLLNQFKKSQLAFISKRENNTMFLVGKIMHKLQCQLVNRENDREALKTILRCVEILKEDKASIGIFPEGYIYPDRKLHHFRPGVFKIAQKTGVPIVVCTLKGTRDAIPNFLHYKRSDIEASVLTVIQPEEYAGLPTTEIARRIYEIMAADLGPENVSQEENA